MSKLLRLGAMCLACLAVAAPLVYAREGGRRAGGAEAAPLGQGKMRGAEGEAGRRPGADRGVRPGQAADRMMQMREGRELNMPLAGSEKARAELQRHRTVLAELLKSVEELRAEIKKAGEDGKEAAIKDNLEKAKALAGRVIAEYATHLTNMSKIAEEEGEAATEKLAAILLKGPPERGEGRPRRAGAAPKEGGAEKKVEGGEANPFHE